ncbi:MAG: AraC family transcriptional regulator [Ruminococcaceae bacterium]|nr:AraC family transcriptional regulator [Oscillospiraceae bacterium]
MYGKNLYYSVYYYTPSFIAIPQRKADDLSLQLHYDGKPVVVPEITNDYCCQKLMYWNEDNSDFQIVNLGIDRVYPGYIIKNRCNSSLTLNFILSGKGTFNGEPFEAGQCYYVRPRQLQYIEADKDDPWHSVWLTVNGNLAKTLTERLDKLTNNQRLPLQSPESILRLANIYLRDIGLVHNIAELMEQVVRQFLTFILPEEEENSTISPRLRMIIDQSIDYIRDNINTVNVQTLAYRAHLDTRYFTKVFTSVTNLSPQEFIMKTKMKIAAQYLISTDYSIEQIAEILGYNHRNCLSIPFKKRFGLTPPDYRIKYGQVK